MKPNIFQYKDDYKLELGEKLPGLSIAYHTYGTLNEAADNVIWVCHALTANSEVEKWWPGMIGEGKVFDPENYFIVSANILGSCYGSTGPLSTNPETGLPWFRSFPAITFRDIIGTFELLRQHLQINRIHTITGGSIGGFQAIEYGITHPELIKNIVAISTSAQQSPWAIAFNQSQRLAIEADPSFSEDRMYGGINGLKAARSIALLSYRNGNTYNRRQQEVENNKTDDFKAASYQEYQGNKLAMRFDAYSYYALTKLMDTHNIERARGSLHEAASRIKANFLSIGISSDLLFPTTEQRLMAHITNGEFAEITSAHGHDGFLLEEKMIAEAILEFWEKNSTREDFSHDSSMKLEWTKSA